MIFIIDGAFGRSKAVINRLLNGPWSDSNVLIFKKYHSSALRSDPYISVDLKEISAQEFQALDKTTHCMYEIVGDHLQKDSRKYAIDHSDVENVINKGKNAFIFVRDLQAIQALRRKFQHLVRTVFVQASTELLRSEYSHDESLERRLNDAQKAQSEFASYPDAYDWVVIRTEDNIAFSKQLSRILEKYQPSERDAFIRTCEGKIQVPAEVNGPLLQRVQQTARILPQYRSNVFIMTNFSTAESSLRPLIRRQLESVGFRAIYADEWCVDLGDLKHLPLATALVCSKGIAVFHPQDFVKGQCTLKEVADKAANLSVEERRNSMKGSWGAWINVVYELALMQQQRKRVKLFFHSSFLHNDMKLPFYVDQSLHVFFADEHELAEKAKQWLAAGDQ